MSDRSKGATRVRSVERHFHRHGFRTAIISASGQRRGARSQSLALDGDLIALAAPEFSYPHFIVEVGGKSKSVRASIREMRQHPLPAGMRCLVVRLIDPPRKIWRWHLEDGCVYSDLDSLVDDLIASVTA